MIVARSIADARSAVARPRDTTLGFVPTMGALHEGHLSLIRRARVECDLVALSVFVNPLQFGEGEDLDSYPRAEERDLRLAEQEGVDVAFVPSAAEMYADGSSVRVSTGELGKALEGAARPGHFDGVATVVAKLFNIVEPDRAYFGQKDAQQVAVIKRLVVDLSFDLEVVVCATVRAPDGLALSSRNAYLTKEERVRATALWQSLEAGEDAWLSGSDVALTEKRMIEVLDREPGVEVEYARVVDPDTFGAPEGETAIALLVVAARVGSTRLIDNLLVAR